MYCRILHIFYFSACPPLWYGPNCGWQCNCTHGAVCNPKDGTCICPPGFYGASCSESKQCFYHNCEKSVFYNCYVLECPEGRFGVQCMEMCECQNGARCNPSDGKCVCPGGFYGEDCGQLCPSGFFGENCDKPCDCAEGSTCDPIDGECICPLGFRGHSCEESKYHLNSVLFFRMP